MSEPTRIDPELAKMVSGSLLLLAFVVALPIGIGFLFGAGFGWIAFAAMLYLFGRGFGKVAQDGGVVKD